MGKIIKMNNFNYKMSSLLFFGILVFLSINAQSQNSRQIIRENNKGKIVRHVNDGEKVWVYTIEKYQTVKHYRGLLKILSDSTFLIGDRQLHIDSICQFGQGISPNQFIGKTLMVIGSAAIASDIALIIYIAD